MNANSTLIIPVEMVYGAFRLLVAVETLCLNDTMSLSQSSPPTGESWFAPGTLGDIAAVIVAVVAIAVGGWIAFRSARPRRVLHIWVASAVSLLRTTRGLDGRTEVRHDDRALTAPYVVTVQIVSRSALDIADSAFGSAPLEIEFGTPIVEVLEQWSDAGRLAVREPKVEVVGTALHVGPSMLARQHRLRYTVLLDSRPSFRLVGDLLDVKVIPQPPPVRSAWATLGAIILSGVIGILLASFISSSGNSDFAVILTVMITFILGIGIGAMLGKQSTRYSG